MPQLSAERLRQVGTWALLGVVALVAELSLLSFLVEIVRLPLWIASALAAETLILARFAAMDRWVFGHTRPAWERLVRYHGASAGALVVYWVAINAAVGLLGIQYLLAALAGTGASFLWSLVTNFLWVWARPVQATTLPR